MLGAACTVECSRLLSSKQKRQRQYKENKIASSSSSSSKTAAAAAAAAAAYHALRKSLFLGSFLHLSLILLKLIGIDGGGLLLNGRGLWEVYPAMVAVPFATTLSMMLHALICYTSASTSHSS